MLSALPYPSSDSITIFISYAQEDKRWYGKLKRDLTPASRRGAIILLSGEKTPPGISASSFIIRQMDAAQIILLLLSPSFMASDKCMAETEMALHRAQNESVHLIPLMLEKFADTDWEEAELGQLSPLPEDGRFIRSTPVLDTTLVEVAKSILAVVKTLRQNPQVEPLIGYRSLSTPPLAQTRRVQRPHLIQQIYHRLTEPDTSALVLVGMGGIGKSALAALLYEYAEQQRLAGTRSFTGKTLWLQVDATVTLADIIGTIRDEWQLPALNLASMTTAKQLQELSRMLQATQSLIVLDQFEELLDPQTGVAKTGISEWLDMLSTHPFAARFLITARFSPHVTHRATFLQEYEVPPLTLEEGEVFLRPQGSEISEGEMRLAIERCQGHALALLLVSHSKRIIIIEAIWHLCQAKRQREAYTLIVQENLFATLQRWSNNSVLLELYQYLDPSQWKPSPAIAARIYNETGEIYQAIGNWQNAGNNFSRALACFVLARAIAHELAGDNEEELPWVVLRELRLLLGEEALQLLQHDIEARAEQVIEQALIS
ncbi:MAG: TIR domain-containing protein [Ktedonobacteraceae bacterium]|nr:TIR domain-containing protein [Ktedonobacteraceae bacterium]